MSQTNTHNEFMPSNASELLAAQRPVPQETVDSPGGFAHIPALDGIRGLAILLVLFDHLFWANSDTGNRIFDILSAVRESSFVGVNLFFALSGFLITGILIDTLDIPHFFKIFYARRTLRIFPLYYGFLFMMLVLTRPLHLIWNGWQYFFLTYTANLVVWARPPMTLWHFNINHFWSLQVEEQFYLVWPFIVFHVRKLQSLIRLSIVGCVVALLIRVGLVIGRPYLHGFSIYLPYSPTFSCFDNLLFGCCLCAMLRTSMRHKVLKFAPRVFAVCALILIGAAVVNGGLDWQKSAFVPTLGFSLIGIASASLIAMTLRAGSRTQKLFTNRVLRFFGKYSYGIYVFHYSISSLSIPIRAFVDARFHSKALGVLVGAIIIALITIAVSLCSYHLYESRFLKLKRYFSYNKKNMANASVQASPSGS